MCRGEWNTPKYPLVPGHEIIAQVSILGQDVKDFKVGEIVAFGVVRDCCHQCKFCMGGKETLCIKLNREEKCTYGTYWGGWATAIQHPAEFFFKLPQDIDLKRACSIPCAGCTVYDPIKTYIKPGDKCAVVGIGGLGHWAIKLLLHFGFEVTAITHTKEKKPDILALGCKEIVMIDDKDKLSEYKLKFDFIINTLPTAEYFNEIMALCAPECKYIMVGIPKFTETLDLDFKTLIFNNINLVAILNGSRSLTNELFELCYKQKIYADIEEYSFEDFPKAIEKLENGSPRFRCIVNVVDFSKKCGFFKTS